MDKTVIFAVAGSGKTTHIVNSLSREKRSLIITYTIANYENLYKKIIRKFDGEWPNNITLMRYFTFLYGFCYKPFLSDIVKARGIIYEPNPNRYALKSDRKFYITETGYLYSNRISLLLEVMHTIDDIKDRISTYFDELIIDEVQDIAGRDFDFLERIMETIQFLWIARIRFSGSGVQNSAPPRRYGQNRLRTRTKSFAMTLIPLPGRANRREKYTPRSDRLPILKQHQVSMIKKST